LTDHVFQEAFLFGKQLLSHFQELQDPRIERTKRHLLLDIIGLTLFAVMAGADTWEDIEDYGRLKHEWLKKFLRLPNGIPSHDTIERVLRRLKPREFEACLLSATRALRTRASQHIAIDGKTQRGSGDPTTDQSPLHLVSAWCSANRLTLGQVAVADKSNEIAAIPPLLDLVDVAGATVTIDAMGCQKEIAAKIVEKGGDYVLAVKDNQRNLHDDLCNHFEQVLAREEELPRAQRFSTSERSRGRDEERHYYSTPAPAALRNREAWKGLQSVGWVVSFVEHRGRSTSEIRAYIGSGRANAKQLAAAVRGHWGIENSLHYVLDVSFHEDRSRIRKDHAVANFAHVRRFAASILQRDKTPRRSMRRKRKLAGWDNSWLETMLLQTT
jgi:predicted transposase YbfD/YdcC